MASKGVGVNKSDYSVEMKYYHWLYVIFFGIAYFLFSFIILLGIGLYLGSEFSKSEISSIGIFFATILVVRYLQKEQSKAFNSQNWPLTELAIESYKVKKRSNEGSSWYTLNLFTKYEINEVTYSKKIKKWGTFQDKDNAENSGNTLLKKGIRLFVNPEKPTQIRYHRWITKDDFMNTLFYIGVIFSSILLILIFGFTDPETLNSGIIPDSSTVEYTYLSILIVVSTVGTHLLLYKNLIETYIEEIRRIGYIDDKEVITPMGTFYDGLIKSQKTELQQIKVDNQLGPRIQYNLKEKSNDQLTQELPLHPLQFPSQTLISYSKRHSVRYLLMISFIAVQISSGMPVGAFLLFDSIILFVIFFLFRSWSFVRDGYLSNNWKSVEAEIISVGTHTGSGRDGYGFLRDEIFTYNILYGYIFNGVKFTSDRLSIRYMNNTSKKKVEEVVKKYKEGDRVTAYHNVKNPIIYHPASGSFGSPIGNAVLEPGIMGLKLLIITGIIFFILSIPTFVYNPDFFDLLIEYSNNRSKVNSYVGWAILIVGLMSFVGYAFILFSRNTMSETARDPLLTDMRGYIDMLNIFYSPQELKRRKQGGNNVLKMGFIFFITGLILLFL